MKIAHAQLHMYTNIMYKFQSSTCKTVGEKPGQNCVHGQSDGQPWQFQYTPPPLRCGGYKKEILFVTINFSFSHNVFHSYISLVHLNAALCGYG